MDSLVSATALPAHLCSLQDIHLNSWKFWSRVRCGPRIGNSRLRIGNSPLLLDESTPDDPRRCQAPPEALPLASVAPKRIVPMANARNILIVDYDTDLRDTLVEHLSLHGECEGSAVDT